MVGVLSGGENGDGAELSDRIERKANPTRSRSTTPKITGHSQRFDRSGVNRRVSFCAPASTVSTGRFLCGLRVFVNGFRDTVGHPFPYPFLSKNSSDLLATVMADSV